MLRVANHPGYSQLKKTLLVVLICLVSFPSDWSCIASLCVLAFGTNRGDLKAQGGEGAAGWIIVFSHSKSTVVLGGVGDSDLQAEGGECNVAKVICRQAIWWITAWPQQTHMSRPLLSAEKHLRFAGCTRSSSTRIRGHNAASTCAYTSTAVHPK
jgi:hypothetical protein